MNDLDSDGSRRPEGARGVLVFESGDDKGRVVEISGENFTIGRDAGADLQIRDPRASGRHAVLTLLPSGEARLRDLDSSSGTLVDGTRVQSAVLSGNETIRIGETELTFLTAEPDEGAPRRSLIARGWAALRLVRVERKVRRLTVLVVVALAAIVVIAVLLIDAVGDRDASVSEIVSDKGPGTVLVKTNVNSTGSGWVLDADNGLIVTNGHVVNGGQTFEVGVAGKLRKATVVAVAPCEDLAVLETSPGGGLETISIGSQSDVEEGDHVAALGYPQSASSDAHLTATEGIVSVAKTTYNESTPDVPLYPNVIQIDAALNPGSSGGPLISTKSEKLVGVNSAARTENEEGRSIQGQGYAIGIDRAKPVISKLRLGHSVGWVGFNLTYPTGEELGSLPTGVRTGSAVAGTPAESVVEGKTLMIVAVNGKEVANSLSSYCAAAGELLSGQTGTFTVVDVSDPAHPGKPKALKLKVP